MPILPDRLLPSYDVRTRHEVRVRAPAGRTWAALHETDLAAPPLVRALLILRGMRPAAGRARGPLTLRTLERSGFTCLAEIPGREVALGIAGRFWIPTGDVRRLDPEAFRAFDEPGCASAVWTFAVDEAGPGASVLRTETRVRCNGSAARRRFRLYWTLVGPFSGWIRRAVLRAVRLAAEGR